MPPIDVTDRVLDWVLKLGTKSPHLAERTTSKYYCRQQSKVLIEKVGNKRAQYLLSHALTLSSEKQHKIAISSLFTAIFVYI